jgi:hypothetical protein
MKKTLLACVIASILIGKPFPFNLQQYSSLQQTSITGKISPETAAEVALIIRGRDTLKTPVIWGSFSQKVKPGTYKLVVSAKKPFRNVSIGNLEVKRNHTLNVGELILQK